MADLDFKPMNLSRKPGREQ